jgi:hypothetical protein
LIIAGRVTSLVTKRDLTLAVQIEDAMSRGLSLEGLSGDRETVERQKNQELLQKRRQKAAEKDDRGNFKTAKFKSPVRSGSTGSKSWASKSSSSAFKAPKGSRGAARFESSEKKLETPKKPVGFFIRKK